MISWLLVAMLSSRSGMSRYILVIRGLNIIITTAMQHAKEIIVETERAHHLKYYMSIVEKENDSGIYNN